MGMMTNLVTLLDGVGYGFEIPFSPFDMEVLSPYLQDFIGKISLGASIGLAGFLMFSGLYAVIGYVRGLFK